MANSLMQKGREDHQPGRSPLRRPEIVKVIDALQEQLSGSNLAFLFGAGCSVCAGLPMMSTLTDTVAKGLKNESDEAQILSSLKSEFEGASATIEDYLSELIDYIAILQRRVEKGIDKPLRLGDFDHSLECLLASESAIKRLIKETLEKTTSQVNSHREFVRAIHGAFQAGKDLSRHRVDYFTLNYDTLIEDALALERIPYIDGFLGGATGWWDSNELKRRDTNARVLKLHGSVDWCMTKLDTLPRRVRPGLSLEGNLDECLIWPSVNKHRETQLNPYALLIDQLRNSLHLSEDRNLVLTIIGYSFGDSHINFELEDALRRSHGNLVYNVFTNLGVPEDVNGALQTWITDPELREKVHLYAGNGYFHAEEQVRVDEELTWWKFEVLTQILGGKL